MSEAPTAAPPRVLARLAVGLLLAAGCASPQGEPASASPPDLVVVLVNGLRDGAGPLGTAAAAFRDELDLPGRRSFEAAYTQSVEPHVALGALLTGRYPSAIPLCSRPRVASGGVAEPWCLALPEPVRTLPEVLGLYGYTSAFVSARVPTHRSVLRGFGAVDTPQEGAVRTAGVYAAAAAWWGAHEDTPRLLVVEAPLPIDTLHPLMQTTAQGAYALAFAREQTDPIPSTDVHRYKQPFGSENADVGEVEAAYDDLAATAGHEVATFLTGLGQAPSRERWVVTASLRGASLGARSGTEHPEQLVPGEATLLLERTTHVLLDLYGPGRVGTDSTPVQLVDLAPTLCALGGAVLPAGGAGRDLRGPPAAQPVAYTEFGDMLQLRVGDDLLNFRAERHGTSSLSSVLTASLLDPDYARRPGAYRLSRVTTDPLQTRDRSTEDPSTLAALRASLISVRQGLGAPPPDSLTPERETQLESLRANGYW